jgi:dipeptidyl aminopeptidase/acylaminoacyl peptidase
MYRLLACFALLAAIPTVVLADEIPLADFARHAQFRDIKISPEGDYLAASAVVDGKAVLSLIRLADMKGVNLRPREDDEISSFTWVGPHRVFYTVQLKAGGFEAPFATGEIYTVDADGTRQARLIGYRAKGEGISAELVWPVSSRDNRVLVATTRWNGSADGTYPVAAWMDVATGKTNDIVTAPIRNATFVADNDGQVRFAAARGTDQKMRVYYRAKDGAEWELLFDESHDDQMLYPAGFDRDNANAYFYCDGAKKVGGLCRWNVAKRTLATLWSGEEAGVDALVTSFDQRDIVAVRSMPGRPATTLIQHDAPESKLLALLSPQFPGEDVSLRSSTTDGNKVVFLVSSDRNPGQFYLYDAKARKASFLFARAPWIKPDSMAAVEPVSLKARDGLALHGYLTRPPGKAEAKNLPLVVFVHGGPYGPRDEWRFDPYVQVLASRGYAVLQVNYRGSGGYGRAFEQSGYREWGGKMQDDVTDATHWAFAQGIADPNRTCIFGGSYGGYAALEGAVKEPDLYRCAIGYVGVYDLRMMYSRGDIQQSLYGENYLKRVLGEDEAELTARSPLAHIDRLKAKVMLIVGGQDKRVPPGHGLALHSALNKAHVEHEWLYQRTEGHGFYDEKNLEDLYTKVLAFLDRSIGAAGTAGAAVTHD